MRRKLTLLAASILTVLLLGGCASIDQNDAKDIGKEEQQGGDQIGNPDNNTEDHKDHPQGNGEEPEKDSILAGLSLGDDLEKVNQVLGDDYEEAESDIDYPWGELILHRTYANGIELIIGKDSHRLYQISVSSSAFPTAMGTRVGDNFNDAVAKYSAKYDEFKGPNSDGKNVGWFEVEDGVLLIFDADREDSSRVNDSIGENEKVEEIVLAYAKHFE